MLQNSISVDCYHSYFSLPITGIRISLMSHQVITLQSMLLMGEIKSFHLISRAELKAELQHLYSYSDMESESDENISECRFTLKKKLKKNKNKNLKKKT